MSQPTDSLHLVLEVERDAEPIRGTVTDVHGNARAYVGWIALIGALDELRGAFAAHEPGGQTVRP